MGVKDDMNTVPEPNAELLSAEDVNGDVASLSALLERRCAEGGENIMLSVRGIFNGETVELLEKVPYQKKVSVVVTFLEDEPVPEQAENREKLNQQLAEECRQLAAMNFDDIGTDEEWTRVQNEALFALEEKCVEEEKDGDS